MPYHLVRKTNTPLDRWEDGKVHNQASGLTWKLVRMSTMPLGCWEEGQDADESSGLPGKMNRMLARTLVYLIR